MHSIFSSFGFPLCRLTKRCTLGKRATDCKTLEVLASTFVGTGRKNYAAEAVYLTVNLIASFPKHISYIAVHNRTVNMSGIPGHGKPVDQIEH